MILARLHRRDPTSTLGQPHIMPIRRALTTFRPSLPLMGVAAVLLLQATRQPSPFDDAFITFRYARNIAAGSGFVYNLNQPVLGTTTPLFSAVLASIGALLGPNVIPHAAFVVSIVADCISAWLIFRLARSAFADDRVALLLSLAFALSPFRLSVAIGGMEASLFTLLLLLAFERLVIARTLISGSLFAALAILTRPDAPIALTPLFAYLFLRDRRFALGATAVVTALVLPWTAWATFNFGSPLPHSIAAKASAYQSSPGFAAYFISAFLATGTLAQYTVTPLLLITSFASLSVVVTGTILMARRRPEFISLVSYAPLFLALMVLANAPMFFPWYYYPILPSLIFAAAALVWFLPIRSRAPRLGLLALTIVGTLLIPTYLMQSSPSWPLSREREIAYHDACRFLQTYSRPDEVVLAPDIGVIGWCLPDNEMLDPIGLVSPGAMPYLPPRSQAPAIPSELVLDSRPELIVALEQYLIPFLARSPEFATAYHEVWSRPVTIAGHTQQLHIYRQSDPYDP